MAGEDAAVVSGDTLSLVRDVIRLSAAGFGGSFKKDCTDLSRRVALLAHFLEEIRDCKADLRKLDTPASSSPTSSWFSDLKMAIQDAKRLLSAADNFDSKISSDVPAKKIAFQFQCVTWKLENILTNVLTNLPYDQFDISEEVQEQVELVRAQLKRATERYGGPLSSIVLSRASSQPLDKEIDMQQLSHLVIGTLNVENIGNIDHEVKVKVAHVPKGNGMRAHITDPSSHELEQPRNSFASSKMRTKNIVNAVGELNTTNNSLEENKKADSTSIPDDFLCPISLEIMRDPVIVSTGQTYERSYIQRWIDCGNTTCPKTQQKLQNLTLTPNYVLRSLVTQWCAKNNIQQPATLINGQIKKSDGTFRDVSSDITAIEAIVCKLSSQSIEERRAAVAEIRSLSKRSTDNRILIAEARAIPLLVDLLTTDDGLTQENAVTSILNLSIYENNKGLIMLANAIPPVVQVLRAGSMEARENAAATLFSLSFADENKIIIGASGAVPALVDLLQTGSTRGKKDAATALFNLCIYQGNKGRAVRAGIITALLKMLVDSSNCMVDEALPILSVLASHQEAKVAIVKASTIPVLIDLLRRGLPRNKENAAAILLSLCKRDAENLGCISRLGAVAPLIELAKRGTERAKRKATSLLEHIRKLPQS